MRLIEAVTFSSQNAANDLARRQRLMQPFKAAPLKIVSEQNALRSSPPYTSTGGFVGRQIGVKIKFLKQQLRADVAAGVVLKAGVLSR